MSLHAHCFRGSSLQFFAAPCILPHTLTILYIASLFRSLYLRSLYLTVSLHLSHSFTLSPACAVLRLTPSFPPPSFLSQSENERETACVCLCVFLLNMYTCFRIVRVWIRTHTCTCSHTDAHTHKPTHVHSTRTHAHTPTHARTNMPIFTHARALHGTRTTLQTNTQTYSYQQRVCVCVCACAYVQLFQ